MSVTRQRVHLGPTRSGGGRRPAAAQRQTVRRLTHSRCETSWTVSMSMSKTAVDCMASPAFAASKGSGGAGSRLGSAPADNSYQYCTTVHVASEKWDATPAGTWWHGLTPD